MVGGWTMARVVGRRSIETMLGQQHERCRHSGRSPKVRQVREHEELRQREDCKARQTCKAREERIARETPEARAAVEARVLSKAREARAKERKKRNAATKAEARAEPSPKVPSNCSPPYLPIDFESSQVDLTHSHTMYKCRTRTSRPTARR